MRILLAIFTLVFGVAAANSGAAAPSTSAPTRTVPCSESIDGTRFPNIGSNKPKDRYRLVLDVISVPPPYHQQIVPNGAAPWLYFFKAGLIIRASGQSVVVTVPKAWRNRAAIAWGYGGKGVFSSLRFAGCKALPSQGFAYSGGFYLRPHGACLPLTFRVLGQGRCLRGLGRPEAELPLRQARDLFAAMGYKPALAETEALLEQAAPAPTS